MRTAGRPKCRRPDRRVPGIAALISTLVVALTCGAGALRGQESTPAPVDTGGLASGRFATMEMLYERTIFKVDVLRLTLRFGPDTAGDFERLVAGHEYDDALAESVAGTALDASDVLVRSRFLRHVSLDQFLDGIRENLEHARDDGLLTAAQLDAILADVHERYRPLRDGGIHEGDTMWYRIHGDRLEVIFQARDGSLPVQETVEGPEHRLAVLGGYLATGSDFREPLVRSLFGGVTD